MRSSAATSSNQPPIENLFEMDTASVSNTLKRKCGPEETLNPSKKIAVEEAHEASILIAIQKNKTDSALLRLPDEILEKILTFVIGDRILHVQYGEYQPSPSSKPLLYGLSHRICTAEQSEEAAYEDSKYGCPDTPDGQQPEFYVQPYSIRHNQCFKSFAAHNQSQLSVVLLRLALPWGVGGYHGDRNDGAPWIDSFTPNIIGALTGLKTLEINLELRCCSKQYLSPQDARRCIIPPDALSRFQQLRPRSARVIVSDNQNTVLRYIRRAGGGSERDHRLIWEEKREVAGFYETELVVADSSPLNACPKRVSPGQSRRVN
ncbi:MAG: hypothetical protein Q9208_006358 [Pyrenodesmia sp. 3 TL-2023]